MSSNWAEGDLVALRYITRAGAPGMCWPTRVVRDDPDLVALFVPKGTLHKRWNASRELVDVPWRHDMLRLMYPGAAHSIWLFWVDGAFASWYVNFEEPYRRTSIGFDTNDHQLDIVVAPDRSWALKDESVLHAMVERGVYSREFADEVQEQARTLIDRIEGNKPPFCDGWERWSPDPSWTTPVCDEAWPTVPAELWDRRGWAYTSTSMA